MSNKPKSIRRANDGFSTLELLIVVAISLVMVSMAIPAAITAVKSYQLDAASDAVSGAIQGARYQAIMHGYPYQVSLNTTTNEFQVLSEAPPATAFTATANAVPISGSQVVLGVGTPVSAYANQIVFQFSPNGSISVVSGQTMPASVTVSYNGTTQTLTVSTYGSISVASSTP